MRKKKRIVRIEEPKMEKATMSARLVVDTAAIFVSYLDHGH